MKKHLLIAMALVALPATSRAERKVQGSEQFMTHDCAEDATLTILGNQNFVTVIGTCKQVTVSGSQNHLTVESSLTVSVPGQQNWLIVDATDAIRASGYQNWIEYRSSVTADKRTTVSNTGRENVIRKAGAK
jgi:hypothetical protein